MTLILMIWCKYYIKKSSSAEISPPAIAQWADIFITYITHWTQSPHFSVSSIQWVLQILQVVTPSFSLLLSSFGDYAKLLHCREGPACFSSWVISSLTTVFDGIFFPLPLFPQLFRPYFAVSNFWVSRSLRHFRFLRKTVLKSFLNISSRFNG